MIFIGTRVRLLLNLIGVCVLAICTINVVEAQTLSDNQLPGVRYFNEMKSAVVRLRPVYRLKSTEQIREIVGSFGTGFLVSQEGHILTADHVLDFAENKATPNPDYYLHRIEVFFGQSQLKSLPAKPLVRLSGRPDLDLAVLRLEAAVDVRPLRLRNSKDTSVGARIIAMGYQARGSLEAMGGTINNTNNMDGLFVLHVSAGVGTSGSPVLNMCGEVVAIITSGTQSSGIDAYAYALPTLEVWDVLRKYSSDGYVAGCEDPRAEERIDSKKFPASCNRKLLPQAVSEAQCLFVGGVELECKDFTSIASFSYTDVEIKRTFTGNVSFHCRLGACVKFMNLDRQVFMTSNDFFPISAKMGDMAWNIVRSCSTVY